MDNERKFWPCGKENMPFGCTYMQGNVGLNKWGDGRGGLFTLYPCSLQHTLASTVLPRQGGKRYVLFSWFVLDHGHRFQIYSYEHTQRPCSAEAPLPPSFHFLPILFFTIFIAKKSFYKLIIAKPLETVNHNLIKKIYRNGCCKPC